MPKSEVSSSFSSLTRPLMRSVCNDQPAEGWIPTGTANNNLMNHQSPVNTADREAERASPRGSVVHLRPVSLIATCTHKLVWPYYCVSRGRRPWGTRAAGANSRRAFVPTLHVAAATKLQKQVSVGRRRYRAAVPGPAARRSSDVKAQSTAAGHSRTTELKLRPDPFQQ